MAKNKSKKSATDAKEKKIALTNQSKAEEKAEDETEDKPSTIELKLRAKGLGRENRRTVKDLLENGVQDEDDTPLTFLQSMVLPGILFLLFCSTLAIWHFLFLKDENLFDSSRKQSFGKREDL